MADVIEKARKRVKKVVRVLTDPVPQFVSLVDHGANQTPFTVVKCDNPHTPINPQTVDEETPMKTTKSDAAQTKGAAVVGYRFPAQKFDAAAASKFLTDAGYTNVKLADGSAEGFDGVVARVVAEYDAEKVQTMTTEDGVEVLAVRVAEEPAEEPAEEAEAEGTAKSAAGTEDEPPAQEPGSALLVVGELSAAEVATKYDSWEAGWSDATTIAGVMSKGVDGLPPGIHEINDAFYTALRNAMLTKDMTAVRTLFAEFGDLIIRAAETFSAATFPAEVVAKMTEAPGAAPAVVEEPEGGTAAVDAAEPEAEVEAVAKSDAEPESSNAILSAIAGLTDVVKGFDGRVAQLEQAQRSAAEASETAGKELAQKLASVVSEVEGLKASTAQTRKSAMDTLDDAPKAEVAKRGAGTEDPLFMSSLGFSRGRS